MPVVTNEDAARVRAEKAAEASRKKWEDRFNRASRWIYDRNVERFIRKMLPPPGTVINHYNDGDEYECGILNLIDFIDKRCNDGQLTQCRRNCRIESRMIVGYAAEEFDDLDGGGITVTYVGPEGLRSHSHKFEQIATLFASHRPIIAGTCLLFIAGLGFVAMAYEWFEKKFKKNKNERRYDPFDDEEY